MYNPPPYQPGNVLGYQTPNSTGYVPTGFRSSITLIGLWVTMGLQVLVIVSCLMQANMLSHVMAGQQLTQQQAAANDIRQGLVVVVEMLSFLVTMIFFLMWVHRVTRNAKALSGRDTLCTPGSAVGYFFVPIVNLWKPYKNLSDVWNKSGPNIYATGAVSTVSTWWGLWILSNMVQRVGTAMSDGPRPALSSLYNSSLVIALSYIITIVSGLMAVKMVKTIDRLQGERFGETGLQTAAAIPVAPIYNTPIPRPPMPKWSRDSI